MQATAVIKGQFRRSFHHQARPLPLLHISSPVFPRHRLPRYAIQQTRSIGFTSIIRTAFNAARLPVFLGGATVTGLAIANDKLQDLSQKSQELISNGVSTAKDMFNKVQEGIEDIDIQVPEMHIRVPDLLKDLLSSASSKINQAPEPVTHVFKTDKSEGEQSKEEDLEQGAHDDSQQQQNMPNVVPVVKVEEEAEEEEEEEEDEEENEVNRLARQDQQFMLLCRKFSDIRKSLISINHKVIPAIPTIVLIGSHNADRANILETILEQEVTLSYNGPIEFELINAPDLKEPLVQVPSKDKDKLYEFQEFQSKANDIFNTVNKDETDTPEHNNSNLPMKVTIYASNIPNLNLLDISGSSQPELFKKSLASPSTIIFAVQDVSENSDTTVSDIYRKYDPLGRRTVGILTHNTSSSDKDAADTTNLLDRSLLNHIFSLHLGYVELDHVKDKVQQQQMLRHKLISVLEQAMGRSIYTTVDSIKRDLEETSYSFKVEYNDREITAYSYLTDSMDQLKFSFKEFAGKLGKPQLRREVRSLLEQNVLDVCAEQYWSDAKITELVASQPDDFYWLYKIDLASAAITKSGIGRITTQLVIDVLMNNMKQLVKIEPLEYHPQTQKRVIDMTADLLRSKFIATSDQVENTIKPFKYEVEVTEKEWKEGVQRTIALLQKELDMCEDMSWTIKKNMGRKRLRSAIKYVLDQERNSQQQDDDDNDNTNNHSNNGTGYNSRILEKAKEALFLQDRAMILKYRIAALRSRQCRSVDNKQYCPEAFLNIIAEKLTFNAVMFIQVELLNEFFFNFPLEIDNQLVYNMTPKQIETLAKENPAVQKHLVLQERKMKLEHVMDMLNYLVKRHENQFTPNSSSSFY